MSPRQLDEKKTGLLNMVAAAMLSEPKASATSPLFMKILQESRQVAYYDPEFLLKLSLYVRQDLNIRSTANYLLAMSSNIKECQPFVAKYYEEIIRLPSDWLEVVAIYMTLPDRTVKSGVPTCLRKAMIDKFPAFDLYQLGKYNKERNIKRKLKKQRAKAEKAGVILPPPEKPPVTLKQMIRQLHMSQPPFAVMALLGKRYPTTLEEFRSAGLPGNFDPNLASTRIKLPVPETWETMLSEKGNKASTWESLIDHKKLPFMAMLRNLRNLIITGVSPRHHKWAHQKLSNEDTIAMSRQFPFRFFSAYEVIPANKEALMKSLEPKPAPVAKPGQPAPPPMRVKKNPIITKLMPTNETLDAYRAALDQAVKHATTNNVDPVKGSTVVFCNVSRDTRSDAPGAKGMGGAVKNVAQLGYLLGLMCKYVCEECDFRIWASPSSSSGNVSHLGVDLVDGTILANMDKVAEKAALLGEASHPFPLEYLENLIATKKRIDNLMILSHQTLNLDDSETGGNQEHAGLARLLTKYRAEVNPELLFVSVNLSGSGKASIGSSERNPNNIMIAGFSEQILRFIAERGGDGQLQYVENIDEAKGINAKLEAKKKALNPDPSPWWKWLDNLGDEVAAKPVYPNLLSAPRAWRDIRVFISSTFLDMHGERDVLTRLVFPELKEMCKKRRLNLVEVDLRWGITEEQSQHAQSIQLCLSEVQRSTFFIGMLGERYGWAPAQYDIGKDDASQKQFSWLKSFPAGRSITELEFEVAGLNDVMTGGQLSQNKPMESFFYLRDKSFIAGMPEEHRKYFEADSSAAKEKMLNLKKRLVASGLPVRRKYPATWRGFEDGKAMVGGLSDFADLVFADLSAAIERNFPILEDEEETSDPGMLNLADMEQAKSADTTTDAFHRTYHSVMHQRSVQQALVDEVTRKFYGRKEQLDVMHKYANPPPALSNYTPTQRSHMMVVTGSSGDGKTALMATFAKQLTTMDPHLFVLSHFCGAGQNSNDLHTMLTRLCWEIKAAFNLTETSVPTDVKELQRTFGELLKEAAFKGRLIVLLDAVDELINDSATRAHALEWLPLELPCKFIISTTTTLAVEEKVAANSGFQYRTSLSAAVDNTTNNQVLDTIRNRKIANMVEVRMSPLSVEDRTHFIRDTLLEYHKRLDERPMNTQMRILLRKTDCGKPLYILVACEELRVFGVYEQVSEKIASLGPTTAKLFESVLQRLEADHTTSMVESLFVALLASRDGLSLSELAAATESDPSSKTWQHLIRAVTPFLRTTTPFYAIFHEQLSIAASKRYLRKGSKALPNVHAKIASHMYDVADPARQGLFVWLQAPRRILSELPYHLIGAGKFDELNSVLTDLCFIEAKAKASLTFDLVNDYQMGLVPGGALETSKKHAHVRQSLADYLAFVKQNAFVLHQDPSVTLQQASNEPDNTAPAIKAFNMWHGPTKDSCKDWIEWVNKPQAHAALKMTYNALGEAMFATAVSPDGAVLAMAGKECVIKLFNARTGAELGIIPPSANGHTQWIVSLNFSSDSRFLVSASWDCTAKVWDVPTRTLLHTLSGHRRRVNYAAFSPINGRYVATAAWDNAARVFDLMNGGALVKTIKEHSRPLNCVAWSPDEKCILTASWDGTIKMIEGNLDVSTPHKLLKTFTGHKGSVTSVAMSPNGLAVASSSRDETVALWDASSGKLISSLSAHRQPVLSVRYSWDGQFIATTSADYSVHVFKATLGTEITKISSPTDGVYMTAVVAHPTLPHIFATGTSDCNIQIWDATKGKAIATLEKRHNRPINCLDWSPDGKWIASCAEETTVLLWDGQNYTFACNAMEHLHPVNAVAFCPQSTTPLLASACDGFDIRLWNYRQRTAFTPPHTTVEAAISDPSVLKGHESTVKGLSWHPKGKMLASASRDRTAKIWDTTTGKCVRTMRGHKDWLNSVCFAPDGQRVVTGAWDYHVKHWNLRQVDGDAVVDPPALTAHDGPVCQVRYVNQGNHFVSAASDGKIIVWDAASGTIITTLHGHTSRINALTVLADDRIVSVADDGTIRVWAPLEPVEIATLTGHANVVRSVAFAPSSDRYLIYTASDDETVKVWDAGVEKYATKEDGTTSSSSDAEKDSSKSSSASDLLLRPVCHLPLQAHQAQINAIAFETSSNMIYTAADEGCTAMWDLEHSKVPVSVWVHPGLRSMRAVASGSGGNYAQQVFTGCDGGNIIGWDKRTEQKVTSFTSRPAHRGPVTSLQYRDGTVLSAGWDGVVQLWDLKNTALPVATFNTPDWILSAQYADSNANSKFFAVGWEGMPYCYLSSGNSNNHYMPAPITCLTDCASIVTPGTSSRHTLVTSSLSGRIEFFSAGSITEFRLSSSSAMNFAATAGGKRINKIATSASPSGVPLLFTGGEDSIVRMFPVTSTSQRPNPAGSFPTKAPVTALAADSTRDIVFAGDRIGHLYFAKLRNSHTD